MKVNHPIISSECNLSFLGNLTALCAQCYSKMTVLLIEVGLGLDVGMVTASSHLTKHNRHMSTYGHKHMINTHTIISALLQRIS